VRRRSSSHAEAGAAEPAPATKGWSGALSFLTALAEAPDIVVREAAQKVHVAVFATMLFAFTILQKIGVGQDDSVVPVALPIAYAALIYGAFSGQMVIRLHRIVLYFAFVLASALANAINVAKFSVPSLGLFAVVYLPLVVSFATTPRTWRHCLNMLSNAMVGFAGLMFLQHAIQIVTHAGSAYWPNLEHMLPSSLIIPHYVYIQPIFWKSAFMKPNAVFFLEVSFLSQFLALALAIEMLVFRRLWRIVFFSVAILCTFAGTGLLLLLLTSPLLVSRMRLSTAAGLVFLLVLIGLVASDIGWFDVISRRFTEYRVAGSSSEMRFVEPWLRIAQFLHSPEPLFTGIGAGQIEKSEGYQWWPVTKAMVEYGVVPCLLFYAFVIAVLFDRAPDKRLSAVLLVWFSLEGALLTAANTLPLLMFSGMFFIPDTALRGKLRTRRKRVDEFGLGPLAPRPLMPQD